MLLLASSQRTPACVRLEELLHHCQFDGCNVGAIEKARLACHPELRIPPARKEPPDGRPE